MTNETSGSTMAQSNKPPAGTPAIVDVTIEPSATGVTCSHEWRWHDGPSEGKGTIDVPPRAEHESGTPIHFHLRDNTNRGFTFTDDIHGPIWVQRDGCPLAKSGDSEIPDDKIDRAPKLLKVFNENSEECHMHYRLRFKDKDGKAEDYDPDIKNGGKI